MCDPSCVLGSERNALTRLRSAACLVCQQEAVTKRLAAFAASSAPLLALYEAKGLLRRFTGNTSDEIYAKVKPVVANLFGAGQ